MALRGVYKITGIVNNPVVQSPAGRGLVVTPVRVNKFPSKDKLLHFLQVHSSKDE